MGSFDITSPSLLVLLVGGGVALLLLGIAAWFGWMFYRLGRIRFDVSDHALTIVAPMYGRTIAKTKLKLDEARVVKLSEDPQLELRGKRNGVGLPSIKVGWWRLASADRALVCITNGDEVLYIPTTEGYPLVLETTKARELLAQLKA